MFSYNNFRPRGFKVWATVSAATALTFAGTLTAAQADGAMSPAAPAHGSASATCEYRSFDVRAEQTQGLPGQYQLAYSKKNDALWATGTVLGGASTTATLAKIDPQTMKVEKTVALDTVPYVPKHATEPAGVQLKGAFGIDVDDVNNTVWVTNTVANEVTVYDQATLKEVFSTSKLSQDERAKIDFAHPREVRVADGKAFVGVRGSVLVFDTKTYAFLQKITVADVEDKTTAVMNMWVDESEGRAYFPVRMRDEVKIYDLKDLSQPLQVVKVHKQDPGGNLYASDVVVDHSLNEIYVSSQGDKGKNSGVGVYDKTTGEFKAWIDLGGRALSLDADEDNDVVYLTDFDGKSPDKGVYVIDGRTHTVAASVAKNSSDAPFGVNDVVVTPKGVFAVDKGGAYKNAEVPFTIDYRTGKFTTASTSVKGVQNKAPEGAPADWQPAEPTPINADTLVKLTASPTGTVKGQTKPVTGSEANVKTVESRQDAEAKVTGATVVSEGQAIKVSGTGWKYPKGAEGSTIAVKYDRGKVSINGDAVIGTVEADAEGNWSIELPYPTADNSTVKDASWGPGTSHTLSFLSGSIKEGDTSRGANLDITIAQPTCGAPETMHVTPTNRDFQGYGTLVDSKVGEMAPAPADPVKPEPMPAPSPSEPVKQEPMPNPSPSEPVKQEPMLAPASSTDGDSKGSGAGNTEQDPGKRASEAGGQAQGQPGAGQQGAGQQGPQAGGQGQTQVQQDPGQKTPEAGGQGQTQGQQGSTTKSIGAAPGETGDGASTKEGGSSAATGDPASAGDDGQKASENNAPENSGDHGNTGAAASGNTMNNNGGASGTSGSQSQSGTNGSGTASQTSTPSNNSAPAAQSSLAHTGAGKLMWVAGLGAAALATGGAEVALRRKKAH